MQSCKVALSLLRRPLQRAAVLATSPSIASSAPRVHVQPAVNHAAATLIAPPQLQRRWQSTTATEETAAGEDTQPTTSTTSAVHVVEKAAEARREIHELWSHTAAVEEEQLQQQSAAAPLSEEEASSPDAKMAEERCAAVSALLDKYALDPSTPREEDVSRGLGDALDRLLLLCVPLSSTHSTDLLVRLMQVCARQGRQLSMRTIQHLFARTNSYAEALAIFYAMRRSNFAMSMEAYHAMLYSLQRLEEEGWAQRFHQEFVASKGEEVSEQALDFVLRGVDNQLLPENKPWLGRVMFAEAKDNAATQRQSRASFDEMGQLWVERYKSGSEAAPPPSQ